MLDRGYISKFVGGINDNNVGKVAELKPAKISLTYDSAPGQGNVLLHEYDPNIIEILKALIRWIFVSNRLSLSRIYQYHLMMLIPLLCKCDSIC